MPRKRKLSGVTVNTIESLDLARLSVAERVALMEQLWDTLSSPDEGPEPPAWHDRVLQDRQAEWAERQTVSEDWEAAKAELRRTLS